MTTKVTLASPASEIRKAWVEALRSGEFKQGRGRLRRGDNFCCLGVLCEVVGAEYDANGLYLPKEVQRASGLTHEEGIVGQRGITPIFLTTLNDRRDKSFTEIADLIESNPPGLFVDEVQS